MAARSCQSSEGLVHDVFLSFRGEDVRKSFIDHLRSGLKREGIATFYDDAGLERGAEIQSNLYEAIERSKMAVVTFSSGYAESRWCLDELARIMERKSHGLMMVLPVFYNVDPTDVRHQTGPYQEAFRQHEAKKIDRVNNWRQALASAANLDGFGLQDQTNGYEAEFIKRIVNEVVGKLDPKLLDIPKYMVGSESNLIQDVSEWLQNGSSKVEVGIIYGQGGVGKTTSAKVVYNGNYQRFKSRSFLANVRTAYGKDSDFIHLQSQLIRNITGNEEIKIDSVSEGKRKIKNVIGTGKILVVLDDVDEVEQFHAMFDCPDWFFSGSKILITTRNQHLLINDSSIARFATCLLDQEKSIELFSNHAFGQTYPPEDYIRISMLFIEYCDGLPLTLEVLASSLRSIRFEMWESQYARLQKSLDERVFNVLSWSFDALQDTVKNIFLHIVFYMVGRKKEYALKILDGCDLHGQIGLENLIGKCLVSVDKYNDTLSMHHLIQQMGYDVVRQKPPVELGRRSRILGQKDAYEVLRKKTKKSAVKGLHLDNPDPRDEDISSNKMDVENSTRCVRTSHIHLANPSRQALQRFGPIKTSSFTKMENLDLLLLENVELEGGFEDFPKGIKWLLWKGCSLTKIPLEYDLEELVVLDMRKSCLVHVWNGLKYMGALKILNVSHSHQLVSLPDFSSASMLEWISCEDCIRLIEIHESIGKLENLTQLNLKGCINLVTLPECMRNLEKLTIVRVKGCRNLRNFPINMVCSVEHLNLEGCPSLFMGSNQAEPTAVDLESSTDIIIPTTSNCCPDTSLLLQHHVPWPTPQFRSNIFLPSLRRLSLANCGIHRDDVMEKISCTPSLCSVDLSGNLFHVLSSMNKGPCLKLKMLILDDCPNLESVSGILEGCRLQAKHCESLKRITCYRQIKMKYVAKGDVVIERTSEMNEDRARYLGFPDLSAIDYARTGHGFYGNGVYQAGMYCVCIPGNCLGMLAEGFPSKLVTRPYFRKRYRVPSFHTDERPIRALNVDYLVTSNSWRLEIWNISRKWNWACYLPWGSAGTWSEVKNNDMWLTHWCVTDHRQIKSGDVLQIDIDLCESVRVKLIYEDGEGAELEDEDGGKEEEFRLRVWPNFRTKRISQEENQRGGEEDNGDSTATANDVVVWYNQTFSLN